MKLRSNKRRKLKDRVEEFMKEINEAEERVNKSIQEKDEVESIG
jgi:hypothetical protein